MALGVAGDALTGISRTGPAWFPQAMPRTLIVPLEPATMVELMVMDVPSVPLGINDHPEGTLH